MSGKTHAFFFILFAAAAERDRVVWQNKGGESAMPARSDEIEERCQTANGGWLAAVAAAATPS